MIDINNNKFEYPKLAHGSSNPLVEYYGVIIQKCQNNSINNNTCYSTEETDVNIRYLKGYNFYFVDQTIDVDNYNNPYSQYFPEASSVLAQNSFTINNLNFYPVTVRTHIGLMFDSIKENVSYKYVQNEKATYDAQRSGIIGSVYLWMPNRIEVYERSYEKLQDLAASIGGVTKLIKAGKILLNGAEGTLISQQFIRVDCGTLEVKKKWGGAIDYQTDVSIFLPFIGEQSLNANEVIGSTLHVIYTVDILSGSCIASVRVIKDNLDAVLYQFTGNMSSNYPITSTDYATVFSGALQLAVGVGSLPSSGGVLSLVSASSNMLSGADVKRTGSLSSSSGFMGIKKPYLILSRPIQSLAESYKHFNGFVSNIKMKLGDCNGFTKVDMVHLEAIPCMDEEKAEIESLLKSGVLIN